MTPNYVAKKSAWGGVSLLCILFFWLIFPLIIMICRIVSLKHQTTEFYDGYVIVKSGVFSINERKTVFPSILSVSVHQSLGGRICNFGDVHVDVVGKWDVNLNGVCNPLELRDYLEDKIANVNEIRHVVVD